MPNSKQFEKMFRKRECFIPIGMDGPLQVTLFRTSQGKRPKKPKIIEEVRTENNPKLLKKLDQKNNPKSLKKLDQKNNPKSWKQLDQKNNPKSLKKLDQKNNPKSLKKLDPPRQKTMTYSIRIRRLHKSALNRKDN